MTTEDIVGSAAVFMAFVHESGTIMLIIALCLRVAAGALVRIGYRATGSLLYMAAIALFLSVAAGLALLGTVLDDGWYTVAGLLCGLVTGTTALRWYLAVRRHTPPLAVIDDGED